jgi:hypothetical protein
MYGKHEKKVPNLEPVIDYHWSSHITIIVEPETVANFRVSQIQPPSI